MKKVLKILSYVIGIIAILIIGILSYLKFALPDVGPAPNIKVTITPEKIARGAYLANHVSMCMDCHSTRDWSRFSAPIIAGTEGKGGEIFDQTMGLPGKYIVPNITPYYLKNWTDGEIFRAITEGVTKDGRALFPLMPYHLFGQLDKNDIESIIAYLRNLKSIESHHEVSHSDFPMNFIINTLPKKASLGTIPPASDQLNYGKYMITAAGCQDCHTKQDKGKFVGEMYAGGNEYKMLDGSIIRSSNLTPDKESGIGNWTKEEFVFRFKGYADSNYVNPKVGQGEFQTIMPWTKYAGMTNDDLEAIYTYLHSLKPVKNQVVKYSPKQ